VNLLILRSELCMVGFECAQIATLLESMQKQDLINRILTLYSMCQELRNGSNMFEGSTA
jgi:hypothetical protein